MNIRFKSLLKNNAYGKDLALVHNQQVAPLVHLRIEELLQSFIADQDVKDSSKLLYKRTLKQYFAWVHSCQLDMSLIVRVDILAYKDYLLTKGLTSLSVWSYITSVRRFMNGRNLTSITIMLQKL